jgi:dipeptidyl aminopeptidase/acylaminoacyl peptidase
MRRALLTVLWLAAALIAHVGAWPSALAQEMSWPSPSKPGVVWAVDGDRSLIYALTPSGGRLLVADEPFERLILPQFSVFIARSPDGAQISYVTADDESLANARLWVVDADGSDKRLLASFSDDLWIAPLAWSPDSAQLAYTRIASAEAVEDAEAGIALWRVYVASGRQYAVGTPPGLEPDLFYGEQRTVLTWEDEGIAYRRYLADDRAQVTTVDPVSGQVAAEAVIAVTPSTVMGIQADAITLPCAVIRFSQNDPRWRSENMKECNLTVGSAGCALTSAAMILRYYNVNHSPPPSTPPWAAAPAPSFGLPWPARVTAGPALLAPATAGWIFPGARCRRPYRPASRPSCVDQIRHR